MAPDDITNSDELLDEGSEQPVGPADIEPFISGGSYPLSKEDIVDFAATREAPEDITALLETLEDREYDSPADVIGELGLDTESTEDVE
jgi:hypothetical protein